MSDELRIQKEPTEVNILTVGGEFLNGFVFVQPYHPLRFGREQPADIVNSADAYFPVETNEGIVLVAKAAIAEMDYVAEQTSDNVGTLPIGVSVSLSVTMSGGKSYEGSIAVEGPVNTPRLLDFMNRMAASHTLFLELTEDGRVRLLNRTHIETIRTVD
jgi:hypothetical protein